MSDLAKVHDTRTLTLPHPAGDLLRVLNSLTHQAKNIYNTCVWLIRQVLTAYEYDADAKVSRLKPTLHPEQQAAIDHFNRHIAAVNAKRRDNFPAKLAKALAKDPDGKMPVLKVIPLLEAVMGNVFTSILDVTVLDNAVKTWLNQRGEAAYRRVPAAMAQQVVQRVRDCYAGFFQAVRRFNADPSDMTGRPRMPGYLDKHERFVLEIPYAQVHGTFPTLKNAAIPEDDFAPEVTVLTPEMLAAFNAFGIQAVVEDACLKRKWRDCQPQHIRIVPLHKDVRLEVVVRIASPYPEGSFLAQLVAERGDELKGLKDDRARDAWLLDHLADMSMRVMPRVAGVDLGRSNMAAVAYTTGGKAEVHMGGRFTANMEIFAQRIAKRVAFITPSRAKTLQAMKEALHKEDKKLSTPEDIELRMLLKEVYRDAEYRRLVAKKERWSTDYLHKESSAIVQSCVSKGIGVIVIGQNKGWKQEVNMGTEQNRLFCQIAHATLIKFIRYKAETHGIAVVLTEESYTSKTSFVNGDALESFADKIALESSADKAQGAATKAKPVLTGRRSSVDRNWFHHRNRDDRWRWVHADVNGAFNIIRKVFHNFTCHIGLTLKFTLLRLSPRTGVSPLHFAEI